MLRLSQFQTSRLIFQESLGLSQRDWGNLCARCCRDRPVLECRESQSTGEDAKPRRDLARMGDLGYLTRKVGSGFAVVKRTVFRLGRNVYSQSQPRLPLILTQKYFVLRWSVRTTATTSVSPRCVSNLNKGSVPMNRQRRWRSLRISETRLTI